MEEKLGGHILKQYHIQKNNTLNSNVFFKGNFSHTQFSLLMFT